MAGITGMGTTFNLPNYAGELFAITPDDTPLLSAIGGLTGGGQTTSTEFEWSTYDLRDPAQRTKVEGATAPTAEERARGNVRNVCQIHQEKVSVSYTKQAAVGQMATPQSAPFNGVNGSNAVTNELDWQTTQALKSIALDVNFSFINGTYVNPTTNATARQTRGLLQAITTNRIAKGTSVTGATSATDTITSTGHGLVDGNKIVFTAVGTATNIISGRAYFVDQIDANTFKVSTTNGGSALTLGTATGIAFTKPWSTPLSGDHVNDLLQLAYDNGGISEQFTGTLLCGSIQKRAITKALASQYGQYQETSRNVGGVNVTTVVTDFGTLNVMMDRHMPQDTIAALSLEQLTPVFLNIPGKGVFFDEPLAKTGASDERQLYGEIGLKYGLERAHAVMTGLVI
ncbi:SU10 major capsid protein [Streptomyces cyaneofuscatus]|uniref:SU10 major capsid protein n=1 Tax=Streptomyces cyaneofuscatus TaxID=66883 RepID=UPI003CF27560